VSDAENRIRSGCCDARRDAANATPAGRDARTVWVNPLTVPCAEHGVAAWEKCDVAFVATLRATIDALVAYTDLSSVEQRTVAWRALVSLRRALLAYPPLPSPAPHFVDARELAAFNAQGLRAAPATQNSIEYMRRHWRCFDRAVAHYGGPIELAEAERSLHLPLMFPDF